MTDRKSIEVVAAIIQKGDAIFATQRGYGEWKDYWEAPGGKVEPGESPIQALRREIREELDTEISVDKFLTTIEWDYPKFHLTMHCYMCSLLNDALHLNEHEAARWLKADELRSVNWLPADEQLLPLIERELEATSQDLARARAFIDSHEWHFAKTMPQIPHWYCLRKDKGDVEEFLWFAQYIQGHSTPGQFYGKTYYYFYLDGYKYWSMDKRPEDCDLINRDKVETQDSVYYSHYSFILNGSLENVLGIFSRHESPLCNSDFHGDNGYVFIVPEKGVGESGLVRALRECQDVTALSFAHCTSKEAYQEMCKKSIVPI